MVVEAYKKYSNILVNVDMGTATLTAVLVRPSAFGLILVPINDSWPG